MAFYGEFIVSVTDGGRIVIPKRIRENLKGNVFVLTKGFDGCLSGFDMEDFNKRTGELLSSSLLENHDIEKKRYIFSGANHISIDEQGRMVIPKSLIDFMGSITQTLRVIGVGDHFEVWDEGSWLKYSKAHRI